MRLRQDEIVSLLTGNIQVLYDHTKPDGTFNCKLGGLHEAASALIELEQGKRPRQSNWWVLLARDDDGNWQCLGFVNEMDDELAEAWADDLPPFEVILPIPDPSDERLKEWDGF